MFSVFEFAGPRSIDAAGRVFCYSTGDYADTGADPRIRVYADGTAVGVLQPGGVIELPDPPRQWRVEPMVESPLLTGTVQVGEGKIRTGTVNGSVTVVDGEFQRVLQGWQGIALMSRTGGAAGYAALALCMFNPLLTGIVRRLQLASNANTMTYLWLAQVSAEPVFNARMRVRNKLASLAGVSYQITDGCGYALIDSTVPGFNTPDCDPSKFSNWIAIGGIRNAGDYVDVLKGGPIVIPAGWALVAVSASPAVTISAMVEAEGVLS